MSPTKIVRVLGLMIIVIIALVAVVLDQKGIVVIMESIANVVFIAIGALLTVAFGLLVFPERFLSKSSSDLPRKQIEGIEFFNSREEMRRKYPLNDFLSQTKTRLVILGGSLEGIALPAKNTIEGILEQNRHIEFLLLDPVWTSSAQLSEAIAFGNLEDGINRSLKILCGIQRELGASKKNRCEIRTYQFHPTHSGIVIDPDSPEAVMLVEPYPYYMDANSKPVIVIHKEGNGVLFEKWWHSFDYVSNHSKEHICSEGEKVAKTDSTKSYRKEMSKGINLRDGVICQKCNRFFDFQHRPSKVRFSKNLDSVVVACPYCEYEGTYPRKEWIQNLYDRQKTREG
jgi:RNase P subunit RPR2